MPNLDHRNRVESDDEVYTYRNQYGWFARADYAVCGPYRTEQEADSTMRAWIAENNHAHHAQPEGASDERA